MAEASRLQCVLRVRGVLAAPRPAHSARMEECVTNTMGHAAALQASVENSVRTVSVPAYAGSGSCGPDL